MSTLQTKQFPRGGKTFTDYAPQRNGRVKPQIMDTIYDEDNTPLYYSCDDGKMYTIDGYHKNFTVQTPAGKIKSKYDKGQNPNKKRAALL